MLGLGNKRGNSIKEESDNVFFLFSCFLCNLLAYELIYEQNYNYKSQRVFLVCGQYLFCLQMQMLLNGPL